MALSGKKTDVPETPTAGELDVLSVLWNSDSPMRLADVRRTLNDMFESIGEPALASSSVGTFLRRLVDKGLVREISAATGKPRGVARVRGAATVDTRKMVGRRRTPNLQYEAAYTPSDVLATTFKSLIASYSDDDRAAGRPLVDFARAMGFNDQKISKIRKIL